MRRGIVNGELSRIADDFARLQWNIRHDDIWKESTAWAEQIKISERLTAVNIARDNCLLNVWNPQFDFAVVDAAQ